MSGEWVSDECQVHDCIMPAVEEVKVSLIFMDGDGVEGMGEEMVSMCLEHATEEKKDLE